MSRNANDTGSASQARAVTKSDVTVLPVTAALWVGGAGNLSLVFEDGGSAVTITGVPAGTLLPFRVTKVMDATTATDITALY